MQVLEQIVEGVPSTEKESIDIYTSGSIEMYTGFAQGPQQIRDFQTTLPQYGIGGPKSIEGSGSILRANYDLDKDWKLQERFDFSEHNDTSPHINYDLLNPKGSVIKESPSILGDIHQINLDKCL